MSDLALWAPKRFPSSMQVFSILCLLGLAVATLCADGLKDNIAADVRPVPPPGIVVPDGVKAFLEKGLEELQGDIERLAKDSKHADFLPDVEIYHKAVHGALAYDEFYKPAEFETAKKFLRQGQSRAALIEKEDPSWAHVERLLVRGYRSKIDGSVQPYGLVLPKSFSPEGAHKYRLDAWFHGRGEKLTELDFIRQRQTSEGQFAPRDTIVLHLYGRYCNANKLAGEIDLLEALSHVQEHYQIDEDRIVVRGFSMGGAACWQFAVHYADRWAAAAPGAGFSETPEFLKSFQKETLNPTWYEKKLWHLYDCTDWAVNLTHCPTVAYSGEKDIQKQAADIMATALKKEGIELVHVIGPGVGHKYHPDSKIEIDHRIDAIAKQGRVTSPRRVRFVTWTLRYPKMHWVHVDGLGEHWDQARVDAEIHAEKGEIEVATKNVSALTLDLEPGQPHFEIGQSVAIWINGRRSGARVKSDGSLTLHLVEKKGQWIEANTAPSGLVKRPGLQGPIDDAFMDSFMMVESTGQAWHPKTQQWVTSEMAHVRDHWRKQFRGTARLKRDIEITDEDIAAHNLVLWGDPSSNAVIARVADKLPIPWTSEEIRIGDASYKTTEHVPVLIYPNPLNPDKYIVLNSGFTFREYDYLNNARQVPKLPDWALIDITKPVTTRLPGGIANAGFFSERWELQ